MRSHDVQSEMAAGYEPSAPPMIGPDGTPHRPARPAVTDAPPRLCEQGPCRNYHHFAIHMDAQSATGAELDDQGRIQGAADEEPVRLEDHHYCYPTQGVEFILGSLPVTECNRWVPRDPLAVTTDDIERIKWKQSPPGIAYQTAVDRWRQRQAELRAAEEAAIDDAARELAEAEAERLIVSAHENYVPSIGEPPNAPSDQEPQS